MPIPSDDLDIHRSEGERSESDWEDNQWPALPSPPSSFPTGEPHPFAPRAPMKDGQTIASDEIITPDLFAKGHSRYSRPPSSLASLQLCDSDMDSSVLQPDVDYSSGDSVFVCEEPGSYEDCVSRHTRAPSDFDFSEDDEPNSSVASQGPRRDGGLLGSIHQEAGFVFTAIKDDEFDATVRFNSGLNDEADFPFERERRLAGHEAPSVSTLVIHVKSSFDDILDLLVFS